MSQRPWPRDPRDAGRGSLSIAMHHLPVTLFLIFVSSVVAALTQFGNHDEKADALFFSSKQHYADYAATYDEYKVVWREAHSSKDRTKDPHLVSQQLNQVDLFEKRLKELDAELNDPFVDIKKGQVWRLVTPMFLHFSVYHIVGNMVMLWQLGLVLEMRFRPMKFLALVLLIAASSDVSQALWSGHTRFGGMSGVDYGLFGFLLLRGKLHPAPEFELSSQRVFMMLMWLVVCFTGAVGPIANAAHVMGLVTGGVAGATNAFMAGGWKIMKRRRQFRSAISSSAPSLHRCATCGKTEKSDPTMDFYVSARDHQEYCRDHLPENRQG